MTIKKTRKMSTKNYAVGKQATEMFLIFIQLELSEYQIFFLCFLLTSFEPIIVEKINKYKRINNSIFIQSIAN